MVRGSKRRTLGSAVVYGSVTERKERRQVAAGRSKDRKIAASLRPKKVVVAKSRQKKPSKNTLRVRKCRAKKEQWEVSVDNAIQWFRKSVKANETSKDLNALKNFARGKGARPASHMFDFSVGEKVHVVTAPDVSFVSYISALRETCAEKGYPLKGGKERPAQYVIVQLPVNALSDKRRNGLLCVRDWQVIPLFAWERTHQFALQTRAKRKINPGNGPPLSQLSQESIPLVPGKGGVEGKKLQEVKSRVHTFVRHLV